MPQQQLVSEQDRASPQKKKKKTDITPCSCNSRPASYTRKPQHAVRVGFWFSGLGNLGGDSDIVSGPSTGLQAGPGLRGKALQQLLKEIQQQLVVGASVAVAHTGSHAEFRIGSVCSVHVLRLDMTIAFTGTRRASS